MDVIPQQVLLQIVLILMNAFFAASEIAILSLHHAFLKKKAEENEKCAQRLLLLLKTPAKFLSTIQIGITLAGFLASAFAAESFSGYIVKWIYEDLQFQVLPMSVIETFALIAITLILSYFTLVFGELVPKRIAMQKPYEVAKITSGIVYYIAFIMRPIVWFLSSSTDCILKVLRINVDEKTSQISEEEIKMMVDLGEESGAIERSEKEWIQNVFAFDDKSIKDIMTHNMDVECIAVNEKPTAILEKIKKSGLSRFPVYEKERNNIIGILYTKDYLLLPEIKRQEIKPILRPAYFVAESMAADNLFKDMQRRKSHIVVVVDEFGEVSGIVTMEDLLEEIFGNIYDEFDTTKQASITKVHENCWRVEGDCDLAEINAVMGVSINPSQHFDTIGGLVFSQLKTIPTDGTTLTLTINDLKIKVLKIEKRRIKTVEISKIISK